MADEFLGDKIRAGRILSSSLRKIMQEKTELIKDPDEGDRLGTKAEALMRVWVKHALGYTESVEVDLPDGTVAFKDIEHKPDRVYGQLIADRIEGRVAAVTDEGVQRPTAASKVSQLNKDRINRLSENASNGQSETQT